MDISFMNLFDHIQSTEITKTTPNGNFSINLHEYCPCHALKLELLALYEKEK